MVFLPWQSYVKNELYILRGKKPTAYAFRNPYFITEKAAKDIGRYLPVVTDGKEVRVLEAVHIRIHGIVQGVGFRPFVHRLGDLYEPLRLPWKKDQKESK